MGTYEQLVRALEKDNRAEEAHGFWASGRRKYPMTCIQFLGVSVI